MLQQLISLELCVKFIKKGLPWSAFGIVLFFSFSAIAQDQPWRGNAPGMDFNSSDTLSIQSLLQKRHAALLQEAQSPHLRMIPRVHQTDEFLLVAQQTQYTIPSMKVELTSLPDTNEIILQASFILKSSTTGLDYFYLYPYDELTGAIKIFDTTGELKVLTVEEQFLQVNLREPLNKDQEIEIHLARAGTTRCDQYSYSNFGYCSAKLPIVYNVTNSWVPYFLDSYGVREPQESTFSVTVPSSLDVAGSGYSTSKIDNQDGTSTYTFVSTDRQVGFNFAAAAYDEGSSPFNVFKSINSYIRPATSTVSAEWRKASADILAFHEQRYGAFDYEKVDIVEISDAIITKGAVGLANLAILFMPTDRFSKDPVNWQHISTLAHELAHQWFAFMVSLDRDNYARWLNEGFATFAEDEYVSSLASKEFGYDARPSFRYLTHLYYLYGVPADKDLPLCSEELRQDESGLSTILDYQKGAAVLGMVRHVLGGDEPFFAAMQAYKKDHQNSLASVTSFVNSIKAASGVDLTGFMQKWAYGTGYPVYTVSVKRAPSGKLNTAEVSITSQADFGLPVEIEVVTADGIKERRLITLSGTSGGVTLNSDSEILSIRFDPDYQILGRSQGALAGDISLNGEVDGQDLIYAAWAMGQPCPIYSSSAPSTFAMVADLEFDCKIDDNDLNLVMNSFGKSEN